MFLFGGFFCFSTTIMILTQMINLTFTILLANTYYQLFDIVGVQ